MQELCIPLSHPIPLEDYSWICFLFFWPHTTHQPVMLHPSPHATPFSPHVTLNTQSNQVSSPSSKLRPCTCFLPDGVWHSLLTPGPWDSPFVLLLCHPSPTKEVGLCSFCSQCTLHLLNNGFLTSLPLGFGSILIRSKHLLSVHYMPRTVQGKLCVYLQEEMNVECTHEYETGIGENQSDPKIPCKVLTISTHPLLFPNPRERLTGGSPARIFIQRICVLVRTSM